MADVKTLITADQLFDMSFPDERVELSEGELIRMAPAGFEHGRVAMNVAFLLRAFTDRHGLGTIVSSETGFRLDEQTVRSPDVALVSRVRTEGRGSPEAFWPGAPDLAVEVVSPGDDAADLERKIEEYFRAGTRLVWAVYPRKKRIHVFHNAREMRVLEASDMLSGNDVLPGFSIPVEKIFL
jgi:Uma2 family endonuclease